MTTAFMVIESYCHATEDEKRVLHAMLNILPDDVKQDVRVEESLLEGHYGNPIKILRITLYGDDMVIGILKGIISLMETSEIKYLLDTMDLRLDKNLNLYLRIDKNEAYIGKIKINEHGDDIIKIRFSLSKRKILRDLLEYLKRLTNEKH
ncbi:MAG: exosome protein [Thermoprotei archaeon]|mgnify:CR=1 FL=1|nr:MAG: exosome protein [Thermoprotei archaeon]